MLFNKGKKYVEVMGKEKQMVNMDTEVVSTPVAELKDKALGIVKYNGKWLVVEIYYDMKTEMASQPNIIHTCDDRMDAIERFKIKSAENYM